MLSHSKVHLKIIEGYPDCSSSDEEHILIYPDKIISPAPNTSSCFRRMNSPVKLHAGSTDNTVRDDDCDRDLVTEITKAKAAAPEEKDVTNFDLVSSSSDDSEKTDNGEDNRNSWNVASPVKSNVKGAGDASAVNLSSSSSSTSNNPNRDPLLLDQYLIPKFQCTHRGCRIRFTTKRRAAIHKMCHTTEDSAEAFCCLLCRHEVETWVRLQHHLWTVHSQDVDMLTCGLCKTYKTNSSESLRTHQKSHFRPYSCELCQETFLHHSQLNKHRQVHEPPPSLISCNYECNMCDKIFTLRESRNRHFRQEHGVEMIRFSCPRCDYSTTRINDYRKHIRSHANDEPFICLFCYRRFTDGSSFNEHVRTHHDELVDEV